MGTERERRAERLPSSSNIKRGYVTQPREKPEFVGRQGLLTGDTARLDIELARAMRGNGLDLRPELKATGNQSSNEGIALLDMSGHTCLTSCYFSSATRKLLIA